MKPSKSKGLSERAKLLLRLVDKHSEVDWTTGELKGFWVPRAEPQYVEDIGGGPLISLWVHGPGDANALKGLERKGLIRRPKTTLPNEYIYVITEDGRAAVEEIENPG